MIREDFNVGRIVPSTRDLLAGLGMRRRSLALVPFIESSAGDGGLGDIERLRDTVRAFASDASGAVLRGIALATSDVPVLLTTACRTAEDCQRGRYDGADGVCIDPTSSANFPELLRVAHSMRMLPIVLATGATPFPPSTEREARAFVIDGSLEQVLFNAASFPRQAVLIVDWTEYAFSPDELQRLSGHVDSVLVGPLCYRADGFQKLLEALDA